MKLQSLNKRKDLEFSHIINFYSEFSDLYVLDTYILTLKMVNKTYQRMKQHEVKFMKEIILFADEEIESIE